MRGIDPARAQGGGWIEGIGGGGSGASTRSGGIRREGSAMIVKVLGRGCSNCKATIALIEQVAKAQGIEVAIEKIEDLESIVGYGVMATPGIVIDGKVVHAGGRPSQRKVEQLLHA
jgi:small redox-active disulfide protein 2